MINGKTWRAAGRPEVNDQQLIAGIEVEMEHTANPKEAMFIALDHLAEIPDYYDRLIHMEKEAMRGRR